MQSRFIIKPVICFAALWTLMGCGAGGEVTPISGMVTYQGKPVPTGNVTFIQISSAGDRVQKISYDIQNGQYGSADSRGIVKDGQYLVEVDGFEASSGASDEEQIRLFPIWQSELEQPLEMDTFDIEVQPKSSR